MEIPFYKSPHLILGIILLFVLAFQYPFSVTVPIGGDAPSHVATAQHLKLLLVSPYRLSSLLFAAMGALPMSWLFRFTVFMAIGYTLSGLLLALLLRKIADNLTATLGLVFWAVSVWDVLPFYRDGTLAQLWSIPFLLLFFYAASTQRKKLLFVAWVCLYFAHPATFAIVSLVLLLITPYHAIKTKYGGIIMPLLATTALAFLGILIFFLFPKYFPYSNISEFVKYISIKDFLETRVGTLFFLAPLGLLAFFSNNKLNIFTKQLLLGFAVLSFFTTFNSLLGVGAWERRFAPYFILSLIIFGAIGLSSVLKEAIPQKFLLFVVVLFLSISLASHAWLSSAGYYRHFNGDRASLHSDELKAYQWIDVNLPAKAVVLQTLNRGRGIEWLSVFSKRNNYVLDYQPVHYSLLASCAEILKDLPKIKTKITYAIFYTWTERPPQSYLQNPAIFPLIYKNPEVEIYKLPTSEQITPELLNQCED